MSTRRFLAKVGLVSKKLFEEFGSCTWGLMLGTAPKGVFNGATKHTTDESFGILALEMGDRVNGIFGRPSIRSRLIT
jgi:hypothetical protein